jgi:hypothetical protein
VELLEDRTLPAAAVNDAFVAAVYQNGLGRTAAPGDVAYWTGFLNAGATRTQVAGGVLAAAEYQQRQVGLLYQAELGRQPDAAGLASWVGLLQAGADLRQVEGGILGSAEFLDRSGGTIDGFLRALYHGVLQRGPDPFGANVFGTDLVAGLPRGVVAMQVLGSPEAQQQALTALYQQDLGRLPDAGAAYWLAALQAGQTETSVQAALLGSDEFLAKLPVSQPAPAPGAPPGGGQPPPGPVAPPGKGGSYSPLNFEPNQGQTDGQVQFLAHGRGTTLFLTPAEAVLNLLDGSRAGAPDPPAGGQTGSPPSDQGDPQGMPTVTGMPFRVHLDGARADAPATPVDRQSARSNYLIGNDPAQWHVDVPNFAGVRYQDLYPGVDLLYHGNKAELESDFTVNPGADPGAIGLSFPDAQSVSLDGAGRLELRTPRGTVTASAPVLFQEVKGVRQAVGGRFVLRGGNAAGFAVDAYDPTRPLVIDPTYVFSTLLGGQGLDGANAVAADPAGDAYAVGNTASMDFPVSSGAFQTTNNLRTDVFVTKLDPNGNLVWSTFLGGRATPVTRTAGGSPSTRSARRS